MRFFLLSPLSLQADTLLIRKMAFQVHWTDNHLEKVTFCPVASSVGRMREEGVLSFMNISHRRRANSRPWEEGSFLGALCSGCTHCDRGPKQSKIKKAFQIFRGKKNAFQKIPAFSFRVFQAPGRDFHFSFLTGLIIFDTLQINTAAFVVGDICSNNGTLAVNHLR